MIEDTSTMMRRTVEKTAFKAKNKMPMTPVTIP